MRTILRLLLATLMLSFTAVPLSVEAAAKKKPVAVKKRHKQVVHKQVVRKQVVRKQQVRKQQAVRKHRHVHVAALSLGSALIVQSAAAVVMDQTTGAVLFEKNADAVLPIASITKLMTAMVALDAAPNLSEILSIAESDVDTLRGSRSRLAVGVRLPREDMLRLALMSSENRAASALARNYPGGRNDFIAAMNRKAQALGLHETHFDDPTGLTATNVSSAHDLVKLVPLRTKSASA